jgi:EAL domain-containing protein (putative c-di-GMP-specific phosphodiesterase class I)
MGKNNYKVFSYGMNKKIIEKLETENNLRHALKNNEFVVYYQPKVNINTGKFEGAEALVRWQHPELGLLPPGKFIPIAEESDLIIPIGEKVLRIACIQNKKWQDSGYHPIKMAVNLSARQFRQGNLVGNIKQILKETGLDPKWLELEITESIAVKDFGLTNKVLNELKEMGIDISLDDFGTGYSSLNYLHQLPIDVLKIDKTFIDDVTVNTDKKVISNALITIAHSFDLSVIAEGVETTDQLSFLKNAHCDMVQGYLFSRPVPSEQFESLLMHN